MSRNNVKLLTATQLDKLNDKYEFFVEDNDIVVKMRHYNRSTKHPLDKSFFINSKIRKISFSLDAINLWLKLKDETKYTLLDIQQAVNSAYVLYIEINEKNILDLLKKPIICK